MSLDLQKALEALCDNTPSANVSTGQIIGGVRKLIRPELMPNSFDEFKGQKRIKGILQDTLRSATKQGKAVDHILLEGTAGGGKTTLAYLLAKESKRYITSVVGSSLIKPIDIYNIFKEIEKEKLPIIFTDEVHGISKKLLELLYIPMETPGVSINIPGAFGTKNVTEIKIGAFTLIGASAGESGRLPKPMLDRFQLKLTLDPYNLDDICNIITQSSNKLKIDIGLSLIKDIALRSNYIPRKANNLLKMIINRSISKDVKISKEVLEDVWKSMEIDEIGLDRIGRKILRIIASSPRGSLGVRAIASMIGADERTLVSIYEPQLLNMGLISYLPRGRAITEKGMEYLRLVEGA